MQVARAALAASSINNWRIASASSLSSMVVIFSNGNFGSSRIIRANVSAAFSAALFLGTGDGRVGIVEQRVAGRRAVLGLGDRLGGHGLELVDVGHPRPESISCWAKSVILASRPTTFRAASACSRGEHVLVEAESDEPEDLVVHAGKMAGDALRAGDFCKN
ncbi:MAG: hypothetical protein WDM96_02405 [Lacunisphaera sp.]